MPITFSLKRSWRIVCLFVAGFLSVFLLHTAMAQAADAQSDICRGIGALTDGGGANCSDPEDESSIGEIVANVINIVSVVVAVAAIIAILLGGLKFVSSRGDTGAVKTARDTILYAILGLVVVAVAQLAVQFTVRASTQDPVVRSTPPASVCRRGPACATPE